MESATPPRSNVRTFWDWFLVGAALGLIYSLFRNPGGCACCGGCLVLTVVIFVVLTAALLVDHWLLAAIVLLVVFALWYRSRRGPRP